MMRPTAAATPDQSSDGLIDLVPVLRKLVYADDRMKHAIWPMRSNPQLRQQLRAERECARQEAAAKMLAFGWIPPGGETEQ